MIRIDRKDCKQHVDGSVGRRIEGRAKFLCVFLYEGVYLSNTAWSYCYRYYDLPEHAKELPDGLDISKYVGGSIVVFNLDTKQVKWTVELDLSTDSVSYRAYIYSSPTVVDVDEDGFSEIVVGTSFGFLYVLQHNGISSLHLNFESGCLDMVRSFSAYNWNDA